MKEWNFPNNDGGEIAGIGNSGIETFLGTKFSSLAREICQNSIDARSDITKPAIVEFHVFSLPTEKIPGIKELKKNLSLCQMYWSEREKYKKNREFFDRALGILDNPNIQCMRISDFNTNGLLGSNTQQIETPWYGLVRSSGASPKGGEQGGSFGIGKYASFACSDLRTVFYSTSAQDGCEAYQGVSRLTSFKTEEGIEKQPVGYFTERKEKQNCPITQQLHLDHNFNREKENHGTDIFIIAYNGDKSWKTEMISAVLDGFMVALAEKKLQVKIDDEFINEKTLSEYLKKENVKLKEHADQYYDALKNGKNFTKEIGSEDPEIYGKIKLYLIIKENYCRRVACVRSTGMKILDKTHISGSIPFAGIMCIEGEELNSFLRNLENPEHKAWEIARAEPTERTKAKKLIETFTKFIRESLSKLCNEATKEQIDAGVGEYLASEEQNASDDQNGYRDEISDAIKDILIKPNTFASDAASKHKNKKKTEKKDEEGDLQDYENEGSTLIPSQITNPKPEPTPPHPVPIIPPIPKPHPEGEEQGQLPNLKKNKLQPIAPLKVKVIVINKEEGEYILIVTPTASAKYVEIQLQMAAESSLYPAKILSAECVDIPAIKIKEDRITGISFEKDKVLKIKFKLDYHDYASMEVKAYEN